MIRRRGRTAPRPSPSRLAAAATACRSADNAIELPARSPETQHQAFHGRALERSSAPDSLHSTRDQSERRHAEPDHGGHRRGRRACALQGRVQTARHAQVESDARVAPRQAPALALRGCIPEGGGDRSEPVACSTVGRRGMPARAG